MSNYCQESLFELIRQNIARWCQQAFCFQKFVDNAQQCLCPLHLKQTFPPIIWIFTGLKVIELNPGFLLKSFLLYLWIAPYLCAKHTGPRRRYWQQRTANEPGWTESKSCRTWRQCKWKILRMPVKQTKKSR